MSKLTEEEKSEAHNRGQEDASENQSRFRSEPWAGPFESHEHYQERRDQYEKGYDHTSSQKDGSSGESDSGSGCFLSTACIAYAGLADDCKELTVLRRFRDSYVAKLPTGRVLLHEYYLSAPLIVHNVEARPDRQRVWLEVFKVVQRAVFFIETGKFDAALSLYAKIFQNLCQRFLLKPAELDLGKRSDDGVR